MTGNELRKQFIDYFVRQKHTLVQSDSLVPKNDPTLLFTNAGMVQFKNVFLGEEKRGYTRAVTAQKCVRAGGKHNDLEMVGHTARHHTFFEMLGNFSFGDYFKKEAIQYGWEFLTEVIKLPREKLYISVFREDDEAFKIWNESIGIAKERIFRMDEKDNFWAMGNTGPCGPCSEIYVDQGKHIGCGKPTCTVGCDCDRFLEIWNLVFMQFDRDESGKMTPLPSPCIDTGMGLERLAAVVQGKPSNYDSDLMIGLIHEIAKIIGTPYGKAPASDVSLRVLADHARSVTFLIGDGVLPSNEGRGYVLRRILRRALRHGKLMGNSKPFFQHITDHVVSRFKDTYPELESHHAFIKRVVANEEENFGNTLNHGIQRLDEILEKLKKAKQTIIPGDEIFKLYDTFGFPVDLVEETARDIGYTLDMNGFSNAMQEQKEKAMASWKGSGEKGVSPYFNELLQKSAPTQFIGYGQTQAQSQVVAILKDNKPVESANSGEEIDFITVQTPFYGESGGQMGDSGHAYNDHTQLEIISSIKPIPEFILHKAKVITGNLKTKDAITLEVNTEKRHNTAIHHTSTHLLHAALKEVLGEHVKQAGSLVTHDKLRFDYTHFSPLTPREKTRIETLVNEKIQENIKVDTQEMEIASALEQGATALFGEKYGSSVRVVNVPGFSKELCGGTHTSATGNIGIFKIIHEGGIASGVRRIEAASGMPAYDKIQAELENLTSIRSLLKAQPEEEMDRLKKLLDKSKALEKEILQLKEKLVGGTGTAQADEISKIGEVSLLVKKMDGMDATTLRTFIDNAKNQIKTGVIVIGSVVDGKVILAAGVTKDLTDKYHAGNILKEIAIIVGGSGGGRPDMAQAGGTQPEKLEEALQQVQQIISRK